MKCVVPAQGDGARTSITLDFGDGHALTYSNVSSIEDGIKHIYKAVGIYRVTATGENSLGAETTTLFLHVTCEYMQVSLLATQQHAGSCIRDGAAFISRFSNSCFWLFTFCLFIYLISLLYFITVCGIGGVVSFSTVWRALCFIFSQNVHPRSPKIRNPSLPVAKQTSETEQIPPHWLVQAGSRFTDFYFPAPLKQQQR